MTAKYRADGYVLSRAVVPAQTIHGGIIRLVVVEGFIDRIIIERDDLGFVDEGDEPSGAEPPRTDLIARYASLSAGERRGYHTCGILASIVIPRGRSWW